MKFVLVYMVATTAIVARKKAALKEVLKVLIGVRSYIPKWDSLFGSYLVTSYSLVPLSSLLGLHSAF